MHKEAPESRNTFADKLIGFVDVLGFTQLVEKAEAGEGIFRRVTKAGTVWGTGMTEKVVWHVVREHAAAAGIATLAPHDLRRSCARLVSFGRRRVGANSVLARPRLDSNHGALPLGCKQRIEAAVNDRLGIEPPA